MVKYYYIIRNHPWGGFSALKVEDWFDFSQIPYASIYDRRFKTVEDACNWAWEQKPELGVEVYDECRDKDL